MSYTDLVKRVLNHFNLGSNKDQIFLLQIFDTRYRVYVEFDDEYINKLRKRLPRTSIETILARIVCQQQLYLLSQQSFFSMREKQTLPNHIKVCSTSTTFSLPPYMIIWLDEYFAIPTNFRSIKRYLFTATQLEGPICDPYWIDSDIDNVIRTDCEINFHLPDYISHLKLFADANECLDYIRSQENNLILFITSNRNAREMLPSIYDKNLSTYILIDDWHDFEWGLDYIGNLQMFDDDQYMLLRIIRDLARYLVDSASQVPPIQARIHLNWARRLYIQADRGSVCRSFRDTSKILQYIDHQIGQLDSIVQAWNKDRQDNLRYSIQANG